MGIIKNTIKGAKETVSNFRYAAKSNLKSKKNLDDLTISKAKKIYSDKTGKEMTPSRLKADMDGIFIPKDTREYLKNKKVIRKDYAKKFGL